MSDKVLCYTMADKGGVNTIYLVRRKFENEND